MATTRYRSLVFATPLGIVLYSSRCATDEMSEKADRQLYTFLTPSDGAGRGERVGPGSVWRGFTDTTTSHGVPHVRRSVGQFNNT